MGVMRATDQVTIVEGGIGDTTELKAKVEELNNNLNSEITRAKNAESMLTNNLSNKLKYFEDTKSTDAYGCFWIGTQGDDGSIPISAILLGDGGWKECTIISYSSNDVKNFGGRIRNLDGSFCANQSNIQVGIVWANPIV